MPPSTGQPRPRPTSRPVREGAPHLRLVHSAPPGAGPDHEPELRADPPPEPVSSPGLLDRSLSLLATVVLLAAAVLAIVLLAHVLGERGWYRLA